MLTGYLQLLGLGESLNGLALANGLVYVAGWGNFWVVGYGGGS